MMCTPAMIDRDNISNTGSSGSSSSSTRRHRHCMHKFVHTIADDDASRSDHAVAPHHTILPSHIRHHMKHCSTITRACSSNCRGCSEEKKLEPGTLGFLREVPTSRFLLVSFRSIIVQNLPISPKINPMVCEGPKQLTKSHVCSSSPLPVTSYTDRTGKRRGGKLLLALISLLGQVCAGFCVCVLVDMVEHA